MKSSTPKKTAVSVALDAAMAALPIVSPLAGALLTAVNRTEVASQTGEIDALVDEARRQELSLHMAKLQAQVAQELAIARRIENAVEVEIEEFYEVNAKAGANASATPASFNASLGGEGRKVTRRVYRFKGQVSGDAEA